jgi:uncharacterized protein with NRDE domain
MLYEGSFKAFNLVFGNILDQAYNGKRTNGTLRYYQDLNLPENCKFFTAPKIVIPEFAHGLSNGSLNEWEKVMLGRTLFFDQFLAHEREVK